MLKCSQSSTISKALNEIVRRDHGLVIAIFGGSGVRLKRRRAVAEVSRGEYGFTTLIPEADFP